MSAHIHTRLHGLLRLLLPDEEGECVMCVPEGSKVSDILKAVNAEDQVWLVAVNNQVVRVDRELHDGDVLDCYPPMVGG